MHCCGREFQSDHYLIVRRVLEVTIIGKDRIKIGEELRMGKKKAALRYKTLTGKKTFLTSL